MKRKITTFLLTVLMLAMLVLSVSAATSAGLSASKSTVYRGDEFTVTVKLTNDRPLTDGGLQITCGSGLKLVSGTCSVSGATIRNVNASNGICSFAFDTGEESTVSGAIFTLKLQVTQDASFGTSSVSVSGSVRNLNQSYPVSASCAVKIACKHSYGDAVQVDASTHQRTCIHCQEVVSESHSFTSQVLKAATCKQAGSEKLTCACGYTKTQEIAKSDTHSYGAWKKVDDSKHTHTCDVCSQTQTAAHTWNSGTVTKAATCISTGIRKYTCTGCKATKTETIKKSTTHAYSAWTAVDENTHTRTCKDCDKTETADHSFGEWSHDETSHYKLCAGCAQRSEEADHTPGPEATETTDQLCTVCQRILMPSTAHVHEFSEQWSADESVHWHNCTYCTQTDEPGAHVYSSDCDSDCDVCGAERQAPHVPAEDWSADDDSHWLLCTLCGQALDLQAHTPADAATLQSAQYCSVCNWVMSPKLTHDTHAFTGVHTHLCECGEVLEADENCQVCTDARHSVPWWWFVIGAQTLALGIAIYLLLRKSHRPLF